MDPDNSVERRSPIIGRVAGDDLIAGGARSEVVQHDVLNVERDVLKFERIYILFG